MNSATRSSKAVPPKRCCRGEPRDRSRRSAAKLRCVHRLIEAQAERTPEAVALCSAGESLTYAELNARANRLARRLRALGVGPEVLVGLCVRPFDGHGGGALGRPQGGRRLCAARPGLSRRAACLHARRRPRHGPPHAGRAARRLPPISASVVCLDREWESIATEPDGNLDGGAGLHNLAYVIYTSGSTGRPKGAMIHHLGLANYLGWCSRAYSIA